MTPEPEAIKRLSGGELPHLSTNMLRAAMWAGEATALEVVRICTLKEEVVRNFPGALETLHTLSQAAKTG
jgi:hypothetical protein